MRTHVGPGVRIAIIIRPPDRRNQIAVSTRHFPMNLPRHNRRILHATVPWSIITLAPGAGMTCAPRRRGTKSRKRNGYAMKFIPLTGRMLLKVLADDEITPQQLHAAGVNDDSVIRINQQGDIEIRNREGWDVIGGLLGDFDHRLKKATGLDWA
jgi:hypothetical protein